ncbi:hypothetical protein PPYR_11867 [Photinus pyralis]|uniref:TLC domain-containing protein n=1 Tax=Photinus pyralis TaxID=7054 RepID=A0A5N4ACQ3_PHOPY|nr:hypothetical protein PPYR_11867 [Photinus pyralis]
MVSGTILGLAKQLDWSEREVERWFRLRKDQDKPSTLDKFCESAWRVCYSANRHHHYSLDDDMWWYIMTSLSFYVSLLVTQFFDIKSRDFWQMFAHHIITVTLMSLAWIDCQLRVSSLVLFIHEFADIFLDLAKILKYTGYQRLCEGAFMTFTAVWIVTRLCIFPFWIIRR